MNEINNSLSVGGGLMDGTQVQVALVLLVSKNGGSLEPWSSSWEFGIKESPKMCVGRVAIAGTAIQTYLMPYTSIVITSITK